MIWPHSSCSTKERAPWKTPTWPALIVAVVLFAVAGVLALVGKKDVQKGSPPVPTEAISSIRSQLGEYANTADPL